MMVAQACGVRRCGPKFSVLLILPLLAVLPGCQGGDGLSDYQREKNKQEERMTALREQGVSVEQKNYPPHGKGYAVNLSGAQLTDDTFRKLKDLQRVTELDLSKSSLTDDQMSQLNEVAYVLIKLDLSNTAVTDAGLEKLTNLNLCFNLNLAHTKVTSAGVARFQKERLARQATKVKDMKVRLK